LTGTRTALVTGGSGGIGRALAAAAARAGWTVFLGYRSNRQAAETAAASLRGSAGAIVPLSIPLDDAAGIDRALQRVADENADLEAVVLGASPAPAVASFLKSPPEAFRAQLEVNVVGNHRLLAGVWKRFFRPRSGGHVIAVSTTALGPPPTPHLASYTTAKAALLALLQAALAELGRAGLRVSVVSAGFTETAMLDAFPAALLEMARSRLPERRFLSSDEVASCLLGVLEAPPPAGQLAHHLVDRS
jgi:NAD(P)-dependent dehydrogenase (short-subunit alcohol dehydrogenase family)